MNDTSKVTEEYTPPAIEVKGSVNELTQAGLLSGGLDHMYPVGDPKQERPFLLRRVTTPTRSTTGRIGVVRTSVLRPAIVGPILGQRA